MWPGWAGVWRRRDCSCAVACAARTEAGRPRLLAERMTTLHGMAWHGMAGHGMAWRGPCESDGPGWRGGAGHPARAEHARGMARRHGPAAATNLGSGRLWRDHTLALSGDCRSLPPPQHHHSSDVQEPMSATHRLLWPNPHAVYRRRPAKVGARAHCSSTTPRPVPRGAQGPGGGSQTPAAEGARGPGVLRCARGAGFEWRDSAHVMLHRCVVVTDLSHLLRSAPVSPACMARPRSK